MYMDAYVNQLLVHQTFIYLKEGRRRRRRKRREETFFVCCALRIIRERTNEKKSIIEHKTD
jgi:hypothetical protein